MPLRDHIHQVWLFYLSGAIAMNKARHWDENHWANDPTNNEVIKNA
jgi:hypothetical protein